MSIRVFPRALVERLKKSAIVQRIPETWQREMKARVGRAPIDENYLIMKLFSATGSPDATATPVMIDVGAHNGECFKWFAELGWHVHAFEPDPDLFDALDNRYGQQSNVTLVRVALSDKAGDGLEFFAAEGIPGIGSLVSFHEDHKQTCTVSTVTLDQYARSNSLDRIDYLKVDAEGYDLRVLKGSAIDRTRPSFILAEFDDGKDQTLTYSLQDLASFLVDHGYLVLVSEWYPIVEYGGRHRWRAFKTFPCVTDEENAWGNVIGVRDETMFEKLVTAANRAAKESRKRY